MKSIIFFLNIIIIRFQDERTVIILIKHKYFIIILKFSYNNIIINYI